MVLSLLLTAVHVVVIAPESHFSTSSPSSLVKHKAIQIISSGGGQKNSDPDFPSRHRSSAMKTITKIILQREILSVERFTNLW